MFKKVIELLLCILHPVAVVLIWINLLFRRDIGFIAKLTWGIAVIVAVRAVRVRADRERPLLVTSLRPASGGGSAKTTADRPASGACARVGRCARCRCTRGTQPHLPSGSPSAAHHVQPAPWQVAQRSFSAIRRSAWVTAPEHTRPRLTRSGRQLPGPPATCRTPSRSEICSPRKLASRPTFWRSAHGIVLGPPDRSLRGQEPDLRRRGCHGRPQP